MNLTLRVENAYRAGSVVSVWRGSVPRPPRGDYQDEAWVDEHIFPLTGTGATGTESKNAAYFVEVVSSDAPWVIPEGFTWEFGL